ncbi:hypothetical protein [Cryobacterium sp. Y62]|uniref:hypothetical protein n=1 Tax=Cryobacterium sp. Y62 TaxID=2048284 RepID=UPI000CE3D01D|nr:hypothetical protein [Cryobacterium sp. Y62]
MMGLWESITHVGATTWFAIAVLLTVVGYFGGEDALWSVLWLIPHAVILFGVWRGSRTAWAILVGVSVALAVTLAVVGIGMQFGSGFIMNIYWWGPMAHGAALLCLVAFRASRRRAVTARPQAIHDSPSELERTQHAAL